MVTIDRTDQQILALLSKNARMSNKEIAHDVGLAPSSVHERLKRLQANNLLIGAHATVDLEKLGLSLKALLFVQLAEHKKKELSRFLEELRTIPEVRAGWMISGRFDALVEVVAKDTHHLHQVVVEKFSIKEEVHRIETSIIFENMIQSDLSETLDLLPSI
ncbi:MAG: Lrp/AsnC family transcriptional regulator [Sneathiellales bacterium]|nr:Lrp/AsnC family transcriptional regulator [Sneathiellales bacterium]